MPASAFLKCPFVFSQFEFTKVGSRVTVTGHFFCLKYLNYGTTWYVQNFELVFVSSLNKRQLL